jgi:disulfide bond formation protein DsbB
MIKKLLAFGHSQAYWAALLLLGLTLEGVALYFQHVLNEWPCVLCIHVRILVMFLLVLAAIALLLARHKKIQAMLHLVTGCLAAAMMNRAWLLLATERGWIEGECSVNMNLPGWFAIDKWWPDVFSAWTSCGYTPVLFSGITMAEMLAVFSILLLLVSLALFVSLIRSSR